MEEIFVEVKDMLEARERRAERQRVLLQMHRVPVVSFTMNIAGKIKRDAWIERGFYVGMQRIERQLAWKKARILASEKKCSFTGCEALWAVDAPQEELKKWMCALEELDAMGRLMDIDVIGTDGVKLSRGAARKCIICDNIASACARSRAHAPETIYLRSREIIREYFDRERVRSIAQCAERALHFEALTTPKPGLVDRHDSGAHADMDIFDFAASAVSLRAYFEKCAQTGLSDDKQPLERLRFLGLCAQEDMLQATGGVNTHKGAIFALGILCCAAASSSNEGELFENAKRIAAPALDDLRELKPEQALTGGEKQYLTLGLTGARGEAASGFPTLRKLALPMLRKGIKGGMSLNDAGLYALSYLLCAVQDSNILRRRGAAVLEEFQSQARAIVRNDGLAEALSKLNDACKREHISPGGSADLLAAAYFVHFWESEGRKSCPQE